MGEGVVIIRLDRLARRFAELRMGALGRIRPAEDGVEMVGKRKVGQCRGIGRIEFQCLVEQFPSVGVVFLRETTNMPVCPHHAIPSIELGRVLTSRALNLRGQYARRDRSDDVPGLTTFSLFSLF